MSLKALSLFSSAGIGELGIERHGVEIVAANEIVKDRCALYRENHPQTTMYEGDIWELRSDLVKYVVDSIGQDELFLVYATPPCQGMSTNGAGKLTAEVAAGNRPTEDARNRLIIPAMDVISQLKPTWVLLENVPGMKDTVIRTDDGPANILEYVAHRLGDDYVGCGEVISCSDYGIPQLRRRLITIFTRDQMGKQYFRLSGDTFFPPSHRTKPRTLRDVIGNFPPLDAVKGKESCPEFHPLHYVNVMTPEKYWWVTHTPEGDTAYNNQCCNPACGFQGNTRHIDKVQDGKWKSSKSTSIYCERCMQLLPRPTTIDPRTGKRRLISGFHSAYRRMEWDKPSRALTRNFPFEASDNKIHPDQNRVLSIYEALVVQTIADYEYRWATAGLPVTRSLIARAIGESVPPKLIDLVVGKLVGISQGALAPTGQLGLY